MLYRRLSFVLPRAVEEVLADRLWALGTLGLELSEVGDERLRIDAWFAEPAPPAASAAEWRPAGVELVDSAAIEEEDWMAEYRRQAQPIRLGARLVVDPSDEAVRPKAVEDAGLRWLHLPARRAFGTGSHASTRLVVQLLDTLPLAGRTVLDLGTGSGVLAFAALAGGARRVVALDNDPVAALIAGQNRRRNRLWPAVAAGGIGCLGAAPTFDLALVNILPEHVADDLPALVERLRPGADAVFSGLLATQREACAARLASLGLRPRRHLQSDEWVALQVRLER